MNVEKVKEFGIYNPDKILYPVGALSFTGLMFLCGKMSSMLELKTASLIFTGAGCISGVVTGFEIKNCIDSYIEFNK
nr:MAG TPA: hypothetical protein [Caudoviricetes sp.]